MSVPTSLTAAMHAAVVIVLMVIAFVVLQFAGREADKIKDKRLRDWVELLIHGAEQALQSQTGADKKAYVLAVLQKIFPSIPVAVLSAAIEGVLHKLNLPLEGIGGLAAVAPLTPPAVTPVVAPTTPAAPSPVITTSTPAPTPPVGGS